MRPWVRAGVTAFFGQPETGKTTLMRRELARYARRALIFDPSGSASLDLFPPLTTAAGVRHFLTWHSAGCWVRTVRTADLALYDWLAASVDHWRGVVWVVDDAHTLLTRPAVLAAAERVAIAGRHMGGGLGVELWVVAHRPMFLAATIRAMVLRIYSFAQAEPLDLKYLRERAGEAFSRGVAQLAGHGYRSWPLALPGAGHLSRSLEG